MYLKKLFTVTCPLRDVMIHMNIRMDKKEIGFIPTMAMHIKTHVAEEVILQDTTRLVCEKLGC